MLIFFLFLYSNLKKLKSFNVFKSLASSSLISIIIDLLVNTDLDPEGNKVKISIRQNDKTHDFLVDEWTPFYIEGLDKGKVFITLELLDNDGELIETPFNPSSRTVVLE